MERHDPHSYFDPLQPKTRHIAFNWLIDFNQRKISGEATLELEKISEGLLDLDTKGLLIHSAQLLDGRSIDFELGDEEPILGRRLRLQLPAGSQSIAIRYETTAESVALQWLEPEMTAGKRFPFMYSQCQAIHARTIAPCQDTPCVRISYSAAVTVPEGITVVMSAGPAENRSAGTTGSHQYLFDMPQPIPPYLIAIAAGDLASKELSPRSRVWAEPDIVESAAYEFAEVEQMITTAEQLFGPYCWDRYDMIVLPPAFPFGGMENPRMTFLTPTLIAGDRSLVDVIAHELAHSWTGNLVTNAGMEHFWLNEGFTTWAERRIIDVLHGEESSALRWAIGDKALEESINRFGYDSPLTKLRTNLAGIDPDDAFSSIPYEKGARFVNALERHVGREAFDKFIRKYIDAFRFTSITTEEFLAFLNKELPGATKAVHANEWLYETGMPKNAPTFASTRLDELTKAADAFAAGARPDAMQIAGWDSNELLIFLQRLPRPLDTQSLDWLDCSFDLTHRGNYEILVEWLAIAAESDYEPVFTRLGEVLLKVGRMKYLRPLYTAIGKHPRTRLLAKELYAKGKPGYHSLSRRVIESIIEKYPEDVYEKA